MSKMKTTKRGARAVLAFSIVASLGAQLPSHAAPNLVINGGFETSYLPPPVVAAAFNQPVFPPGWAVEGATALFDHSPHNPHGGQYSAQISGSYSGPRKDCSQGPCTTIPGGEAKDALYQHYTLAPAWRTAVPFDVTGSTAYTFRAWMRLAIPKDGTGTVTSVRWFDANHVPISVSAGPKLTAGTGGSSYLTFVQGAATPGTFVDRSTDWVKGSLSVNSPAGARFAVLVLGHTDDAWIGSVAYDDVCFSATATTCP